jgi:hypothetical protein
MRVTSNDFSMLISGRMAGDALAKRVFPLPGTPVISMLWSKDHTLFDLYFPIISPSSNRQQRYSIELTARFVSDKDAWHTTFYSSNQDI